MGRPKKRADKLLDPREEAFVTEYMRDSNGRRAAIAAGWSEGSAGTTANRLLSLKRIRESITREQQRLAHAEGVTREKIVRETARLAFVDPRRMFGRGNRLLAPDEWPDDIASAVASIEVESRKDGTELIRVAKIKFWDKNSALEKLFKHLGLEKSEGDPVVEMLAAITQTAHGGRLLPAPSE
jgi:phage terminase small subunit